MPHNNQLGSEKRLWVFLDLLATSSEKQSSRLRTVESPSFEMVAVFVGTCWRSTCLLETPKEVFQRGVNGGRDVIRDVYTESAKE
jgi:hypothetical protein